MRRALTRINELEIGPKPVVVLRGQDCAIPRLIKLEISGWLGAQPPYLTLIAERAGARVEFAMSPGEQGRLRAFLDLSRDPLLQLSISGPEGMAVTHARNVRISAVSQAELLREAFQRAPAEAAGAFYWRLRGQKMRARNRLMRCVAPITGLDYGTWLGKHQAIWAAELAGIEREVRAVGCPTIAVVCPPSPAGGDMDEARRAADGYPAAEFVPWSSAALDETVADWFLLLCPGDRLARGALWRLALAGVRDPLGSVIYGDHDLVGEDGAPSAPAFKPGWNPPLFLAMDYVGAVALRRTALAEVVRPPAVDPDLGRNALIWRLAGTDAARRTVRVPRLLTHQSARHAAERQSEAALTARRALLQPLLDPACRLLQGRHGVSRVHFIVPTERPLVSMVVPTKDRLDLLEPCIDTLLNKTKYPNMEILIADNGSRKPATLRYLNAITKDRRVRVCPAPGPFNLSVINNRTAAQATGNILAFINNDVEVMAPEWLDEMVGPLLQPAIGAVGAKLLYESGLVQHAGVALGVDGAAGHVHRFFGGDEPGYMQRLDVPALFSAVTTAVALVTREKFEAVGGFNEIDFPAAFNDVDLCLKLLEKGWPSYWTPHALLRHKESASRAHEASPEQRAASARIEARFRELWAHLIADDPYYNPNLLTLKPDARFWPA